MSLILYVGASMVLEYSGLQNTVTLEYDNAATVQCTQIVDAAGTQITGVTWPLAMSYVAASSGNYRATLPATAGLTAGAKYFAEISITSSLTGTPKDFRRIPITAAYRQEAAA